MGPKSRTGSDPDPVCQRRQGGAKAIGEAGGNTAELLGIRSLHAGTLLSELNQGKGVTINETGNDLTIQARGGAMGITGEKDGAPVRMGLPMGDLGGAPTGQANGGIDTAADEADASGALRDLGSRESARRPEVGQGISAESGDPEFPSSPDEHR
jgi:hypothetical protein